MKSRSGSIPRNSSRRRARSCGREADHEQTFPDPSRTGAPHPHPRATRGSARDPARWQATMTKLISFQGEPGANSHIAAQEVHPDYEPLPCPTFEDAFAAVQEGQADLAMIPIENSIAGRVADIHHLLPTSGLHIIGEHFLPIHFQLMSVAAADLGTIRHVYSHVHALGQCRKIIRKLGLKALVAGDTAGSAREVAEAADPTRASLAPRLAAGVYGLKILAEDVEDEAHNTTRFVILSKDADWAAPRNGR